MLHGDLNKVLPLFVLPTAVSIILLTLALRWKRVLFTVAGISILSVFGTPVFADLLMETLEDRFDYRCVKDCPKADAVFVFGGMLGARDRADGSIAWNEAAERFDRAVLIVKAGKANLLVFSGGPERYAGGDEGDLLRTEAIARGVPEESILITESTANTMDEARALCRLSRLNHWTRVLVVTSAFHMARAMYLCRNCSSELIAVPVAFQTPGRHMGWAYRRLENYIPQAQGLSRSELALREYIGILVNFLAT